MKAQNTKNLQTIPGVGKTIARDLVNIGIESIDELKGKNTKKLYDDLCKWQGIKVDRCMLYVFRGAVYFAETPENKRKPEKLKW
jgi:hypothetical protein